LEATPPSSAGGAQVADLRRAAGREEPAASDTAGFTWTVSFNPFPYLDAVAAEMQREGGRTFLPA
jgi:hypothetical protein